MNKQFNEQVLSLFEGGQELMAEEVFPLYEEKYGETSRSNSIHSALSKLTKLGSLMLVGSKVSLISKRTVGVWKVNDGLVVVTEQIPLAHQTNKQYQNQMHILELKNKQLEEVNMKLLGIIEELRKGK